MIVLLRDYSHDLLVRIMEASYTNDIFGMSSYSHDLDNQSFEISKMGHVRSVLKICIR